MLRTFFINFCEQNKIVSGKPDVNQVEEKGKVKGNVKARKEEERKDTTVEHLIKAPICSSEKLYAGQSFYRSLFAFSHPPPKHSPSDL